MEYVKSKIRTNLSDEYLQATLLIETTKFDANYQEILNFSLSNIYHNKTHIHFSRIKKYLFYSQFHYFSIPLKNFGLRCQSVSQIWPSVKKKLETPDLNIYTKPV